MQSISSSQAPARPANDTVWRGVRSGLMPLALLVGFVALAVALTVAARMISLSAGFFTEREAVVATLAMGLLVSAVIYGMACFRALRRVGVWLREGFTASATGALWALGITALVVLLPVILSILMPQHPAP